MGKEDETEAGKKEKKSAFHGQILSTASILHKMVLACFHVSITVGVVEPIHKAVEISHKVSVLLGAKIELTDKSLTKLST